MPKNLIAISQHTFTLGQTVYTAHLLRLTPDLTLKADHRGQVVLRYQPTDDWNREYAYPGEFAYAVQFDGVEQSFPVFEENLRAEPEGGRFHRDERFPIIPGMRAEAVIELAIKRRLTLPDKRPVLDRLSCTSIDEETTSLPTKGEETTCIQVNPLTPIRQEYVGELTGSISGNVYCYGYAVHHDLLLYLNLGGPRMAVEAIRARLSKGEIVNLVPWNAPAIELSAGETEGKTNIGKYRAYLNSLSEAKFTSAILVHECLTEPNYAGKSITGIFRTSEEQATAKLLHHVRQLVKIAVFDTWAGYLYQAGQSAGLVYQPRWASAIDLVVVDLDASAWTRLITVGLANQVIDLPHHLTP